ncbi:SRPBCC family protein [Mycobacterium angelicum]|uniref:SRPBCC family protein n=1 Tax=Mycobacterium angelicum TaxID=470074 RepID=UPI0035564145
MTALLTVLYCAREYYRNWGATKAEYRMQLPGDALVGDPAIQTTEAVNIDAPAAVVWRRLLQAGQGSGGDREPAIGDVVRLWPQGRLGLADELEFTVVDIVAEDHLVLNVLHADLRWNAVLSIHLQPHWQDRVRLLVRARIALRYPGEVIALEMLRPLTALGTRALMLGVKQQSERRAQGNSLAANAVRRFDGA